MGTRAMFRIVALTCCVVGTIAAHAEGNESNVNLGEADPGGAPGFALVSVVVDAGGTPVVIGPDSIVAAGRTTAVENVNPADAVARPDGSLVILEQGADLSGRVMVYRFDDGITKSVDLDERPLRLASAGETLAVLTYRGHAGIYVRLFDEELNALREFAVAFPCRSEHTPLTDIAASESGAIYVASFACDGTYVINGYDLLGNLHHTFQPEDAGRPQRMERALPRRGGFTLTPAASDMFMVGETVGVLLNRKFDDTQIAAEFWMPDGTRSGAVGLPGVATAMSKVTSSGTDQLVVGNQITGEITTIPVPEIHGGGR